MASWTVRSAKARFSEFLDAAIMHGPQFVTRRGSKTRVGRTFLSDTLDFASGGLPR
jgi:hypothetical protein